MVVTDKRTQMDLRVTGDDGLPTREYVAIAFPFDKAKWNPELRQIRTHVPPLVRMTGGATAAASAGVTVTGGVVGSQLSSGGVVAGGSSGYTVPGSAGSQGASADRMVALAPGEYTSSRSTISTPKTPRIRQCSNASPRAPFASSSPTTRRLRYRYAGSTLRM